MGHTHYYTISKPKTVKADWFEKRYQKAVKACNVIIQHYQKHCKDRDHRLSGYSAHTNGKYSGIEVNGKGELAHESFVLREHASQNEPSFCKTNRKPYDMVVVACLATLKHFLRDGINISTDGTNRDLQLGLFLARRALRNVKIDWEVEHG